MINPGKSRVIFLVSYNSNAFCRNDCAQSLVNDVHDILMAKMHANSNLIILDLMVDFIFAYNTCIRREVIRVEMQSYLLSCVDKQWVLMKHGPRADIFTKIQLSLATQIVKRSNFCSICMGRNDCNLSEFDGQ